MKIILERFIRTKDYSTLEDFSHYLDNLGWIDSKLEGGMISPDYSTIFIYNRSPYYGQLIQFGRNKEKDYYKTINNMLITGKFLKII